MNNSKVLAAIADLKTSTDKFVTSTADIQAQVDEPVAPAPATDAPQA